MTLTKAEIVQNVYQRHDLTKAKAAEAVESFLQIAKECMVNGEDLLISGFGKFNVKKKSARRGRNPQTGKELILEARYVVTFKPSGILRDRISNGR
ncbi:MAG: integration host factor subunit alpha [Desulfobulbaceae bacterium]|nr:integration host factor subunit alpha [Desulfobulbaceae bacterium]